MTELEFDECLCKGCKNESCENTDCRCCENYETYICEDYVD